MPRVAGFAEVEGRMCWVSGHRRVDNEVVVKLDTQVEFCKIKRLLEIGCPRM